MPIKNNQFWNFIVNDDSNVELRISGDIISDDSAWMYEWFDIDATSPNKFRAQLQEYKNKDIVVWIDSYGGDVFAAAGIYNALKEHKGNVIVKIDSKAMSAASVIAMAGNRIEISPVGMLMIHNPLTYCEGDMRDMRHTADVLDEVKTTIINAYQSKTGKTRNKISEMMDNETWMSAKTAVTEGFADSILYSDTTEPIQVENNFMYSKLAIQNSVADSTKAFFKKYVDKINIEQPEQKPELNNDSGHELLNLYQTQILLCRRKNNV